jgi:(4-(4-[2-(gamma-L-glutamylamino)ethyl]phenoxymethyl)furan-2-yl)methanamine synthase
MRTGELEMNVVGWDIGGVHLKAARADDGRIVDVAQIAAPLRAGLNPLTKAFGLAKARMGPAHLHVVTMTAELADTFASRTEGVMRIAALAARELGATALLYAGRAGFVPVGRAHEHVADIASANWHASAALVARRHASALFIDMGSTTTDIVPLAGGAIVARGYTDAERLAAGELVYTGLVRGFVMATADRAPFGGAWTPLVNENFANLADVHRILGSLPDGVDQMATTDGRDKTIAASRARLARMVGRDAAEADDAVWERLAAWFAEAQMRAVIDGAMLVSSAMPGRRDAPIVGAGIGTGVVREIARRLGRAFIAFESLLEVAPQARDAASQCAPAAALALLGASAQAFRDQAVPAG